MALTSNQVFWFDNELVDYLESEEECSNDNYIFGKSSESDDIVTENVSVLSQSTPKRSRKDAHHCFR
ncbi:hypothetical protein C0J52_22186 [Blattella germanica]|nr:hypothetical protein C0J52_22186 [Blattella germanica]